MDLRQLRYFVGIVAAGSFSKAAEQLHVAQPALSRRIKELEEELGVRLLHRTPHGVEVTEAGLRLRERADYLLRSVENIRTEVVELGREPAGTIVVGLPPSMATLMAPQLIAAVHADFPKLTIRVIEGLSVFLVDWIELGKIDIAVLTDPREGHAIHRRDLADEDMCLVGTPDKFDPGEETAAIASVDTARIVISSGFQRVMQPWFEAAGVEPRYAMELDSVPIIKEMVRQGIYASILPYGMVHAEAAGGVLRALPFRDPAVTRRLVLARSANRPVSLAMTAVGDLLAAAIAGLPTRRPA